MVKEIVRAAVQNAAGEGVGGLAVKGIEKAIAPGMKLFKGADDAIKTIEEQSSSDISLKSFLTKLSPKYEFFLISNLLHSHDLLSILKNLVQDSATFFHETIVSEFIS
jgi:hypothetical protein